MSDFTIVPRTEIGLDPVVRNSSGSPRRLVSYGSPASFITVHYTGVNVIWGDIGDTPAEIRSIERYAQSAGKPNEYNYVIDQDPSDLIYEYAGLYQAAHSAGENGISYGVLMLNGTNEPITERQWRKLQWLRDVLRYTQPNHAQLVRPHREMPGAATACPGTSYSQAKADAPYVPLDTGVILPKPPPPPPVVPPPVTPPPPEAGTNEGHYLVRPGDSPWKVSALLYGTGTKWPTITDANRPDTVMNPGERWKIPGFTGEWYEVKSGDSPWRILSNIFGLSGFGGMAGVAQFYEWNGGEHVLRPGERVWVRH